MLALIYFIILAVVAVGAALCVFLSKHPLYGGLSLVLTMLSLDVASQTLGAHKIEYEGDLQTLYETDYQKYVFYNAIDSILVQLIAKRFKIMNQFYIMSLFCKESINKVVLIEQSTTNFALVVVNSLKFLSLHPK